MAIHEGSDGQAADPMPRGIEQSLADEEPLCSEEEFAEEVRELVAEDAPQVFALVEESGERVDGRVVAWGMAFDDHVDVLSVHGGMHASLPSVERAHRAFSRRRKIRLVWTSTASQPQPGRIRALVTGNVRNFAAEHDIEVVCVLKSHLPQQDMAGHLASVLDRQAQVLAAWVENLGPGMWGCRGADGAGLLRHLPRCRPSEGRWVSSAVGWPDSAECVCLCGRPG